MWKKITSLSPYVHRHTFVRCEFGVQFLARGVKKLLITQNKPQYFILAVVSTDPVSMDTLVKPVKTVRRLTAGRCLCRLPVLCRSVRRQARVGAGWASTQPGRLGAERQALLRQHCQLRRCPGSIVRSHGRQRGRSRRQLVRPGRHSETCGPFVAESLGRRSPRATDAAAPATVLSKTSRRSASYVGYINVTLLAFAAERRRSPLSIDISRLPGPQQQTRRTPRAETDRQTDGHRIVA